MLRAFRAFHALRVALRVFRVLFWAVLAGLFLARLFLEFTLPGALLFAQSFLAASLLAWQRPPRREGPLWERVVAWAGVLAPPLLLENGVYHHPAGEVIQAAGLVLALWAMLSLGNRFGFAPADRGVVTGGAYCLVRHPMYTGEVINWLGFAACTPSTRNVLAVVALAAVQVLRAWWEEKLLEENPEYRAYKEKVRWRFLPCIF